MNNNEMYHWGIKGMKWGVRKKRVSSENESDDHKQAQTLQKKHISEMSNKELETLNRRLQLEQTYANLNSKPVSKGRQIVESVLADSAKESLRSVINYAMTGDEKKKPPIVQLGERVVNFASGKIFIDLGKKLTD